MKNTDFCASFRSEETFVFKCTKKDEPYNILSANLSPQKNGCRVVFFMQSFRIFFLR
jgi:hypothetical protein